MKPIIYHKAELKNKTDAAKFIKRVKDLVVSYESKSVVVDISMQDTFIEENLIINSYSSMDALEYVLRFHLMGSVNVITYLGEIKIY